MSMFCYQCEQAAMGTGCTKMGVCGKDPDEDEIARLEIDAPLFDPGHTARRQQLFGTNAIGAHGRGVHQDCLCHFFLPPLTSG